MKSLFLWAYDNGCLAYSVHNFQRGGGIKKKELRSSYFEAVNGCSEPTNPSLVPLDGTMK